MPKAERYARYCPYCGSQFVVDLIERWYAESAYNPDNKDIIWECQCKDCNLSFWV